MQETRFFLGNVQRKWANLQISSRNVRQYCSASAMPGNRVRHHGSAKVMTAKPSGIRPNVVNSGKTVRRNRLNAAIRSKTVQQPRLNVPMPGKNAAQPIQ